MWIWISDQSTKGLVPELFLRSLRGRHCIHCLDASARTALTHSINVIMFALDQLIVTVAVPQIVDQFKALEKLAWLNTGFFVPCAAGILIYSQLMTIWSPRYVYLCALLIFEIGSAVCVSNQQ